MTSALMVESGLLARRLRAAGLRVARFLAAAFRFFAMSWSSLDGVAYSGHCTAIQLFRKH
jgi:hypothetical protein